MLRYLRHLVLLSLGGTLSLFLPLVAGHRLPDPPGDPPKKKKEVITFTPTSSEAILLAYADAAHLPNHVLPFVRYIWCPSEDPREIKATSLVVNIDSRSPIIVKPTPVPGNLVRVYLKWYAPTPDDLTDWLKFWEDLQFDPAFSLLITKDELDNLAKEDQSRVGLFLSARNRSVPIQEKATNLKMDSSLGYKAKLYIHCPEGADLWVGDEKVSQREITTPGNLPSLDNVYEYEVTCKYVVDGDLLTKTKKVDIRAGFISHVYFSFASTKTASTDFNLIRFDNPTIDPKIFTRLQTLTQSAAPVVSAPYFFHRLLSTIKDKEGKKDDLFNDLFGGRYYEFAGIKKAKELKGKENATDEDVFLEKLGVGFVGAKVNAEALFNNLRSDQRIAIFRSGVTGKKRRVDMFHSLAGRESMGWVSITHDVRDRDIDVGKDAFRNLLVLNDEARETIADKPNGLHYYTLTNGKGDLLDQATDDVAPDTTIPNPHSKRLQAAISCIACHEAEGSDGWKNLTNDVKKLTAGKLDVFADLFDRKALQEDTLLRLAGLYQGDFRRNLTRAKDDYALAVLKATGPWEESKDQTDVVKVAASYLVKRTRDYWYEPVDARQALLELGLKVPPGEIFLQDGKKQDWAVYVLNEVLPPDPDSQVGHIFLEDPNLGALKQGLAINRWDWALLQSFAARRAQKGIDLYRKGKVK